MRKKNIIMLAILLLAIASGILFYTRPMNISQICSGIDVAECKEISGFYRIASGTEDISFEVNQEYEKFGEILELFESQK